MVFLCDVRAAQHRTHTLHIDRGRESESRSRSRKVCVCVPRTGWFLPPRSGARKCGKGGDIRHKCGELERVFFIPKDGEREEGGGRGKGREERKTVGFNFPLLSPLLSLPLTFLRSARMWEDTTELTSHRCGNEKASAQEGTGEWREANLRLNETTVFCSLPPALLDDEWGRRSRE